MRRPAVLSLSFKFVFLARILYQGEHLTLGWIQIRLGSGYSVTHFTFQSIIQIVKLKSSSFFNISKQQQWRHHIQHNDIQHNDTKHKVLISDTQHNQHLAQTTLSRTTTYIECHYAECQYAQCHYLFVVFLNVIMVNIVMLSVVMLNVVAQQQSKFFALNFLIVCIILIDCLQVEGTSSTHLIE